MNFFLICKMTHLVCKTEVEIHDGVFFVFLAVELHSKEATENKCPVSGHWVTPHHMDSPYNRMILRF